MSEESYIRDQAYELGLTLSPEFVDDLAHGARCAALDHMDEALQALAETTQSGPFVQPAEEAKPDA